MIERPATWGDVVAGTTLLSPTSEPLLVVQTAPDKQGRLWYLLHDRTHHKIRVSPKPLTTPVTILEATEEEAILWATMGLRGEQILDQEREKRMPERAKQWLVPHFPRKGERDALTKARDHLSFYHGVYATNAKQAGFETLIKATEAHQEMHEDHFMDLPHTHKEK